MPLLIQTNFTSGEISPRLKGRVDLEQYSAGADTLLNFQVLPAGGITRRSGTHYAGNMLSGTGQVRLVPFVVANLTAYVLELGNLYLRVWRNRAPVLDGSGAQLNLATPYLVADIRSLRFAQSADVLYITHVGYAPMKLSRSAANVFALAAVAFSNGPYDTQNTGNVGATGAAPTTSGPDTTANQPNVGGSGAPPNVGDTNGGGGNGAGGGNSGDIGGGDPGGDGQGGNGGDGGNDGSDGSGGSGAP